jgi:hypothetical protein
LRASGRTTVVIDVVSVVTKKLAESLTKDIGRSRRGQEKVKDRREKQREGPGEVKDRQGKVKKRLRKVQGQAGKGQGKIKER